MKKKYVLDFANISSELYQLCSKKELTRRKCLKLNTILPEVSTGSSGSFSLHAENRIPTKKIKEE